MTELAATRVTLEVEKSHRAKAVLTRVWFSCFRPTTTEYHVTISSTHQLVSLEQVSGEAA